MTSAENLIAACFDGDPDLAAKTLGEDAAAAHARCDETDSPALVIAAHRGHAGIVRMLLEAGAEANAREGVSDTTALHWAAEGGHPEVARLLLDHGAQIEPVDSWFSLTPLGWACVVDWNPDFRENRPSVIELLLKRGARVDAFCAIALGRTDVLRALSPDQLNARLGVAAAHLSPLHFAVTAGNIVAVEELLRLGAALDQSTGNGLSALGLAVLDGRTEIASRLRAAGAAEDLSVKIASDPPTAAGAQPSDGPLLHACAARGRSAAVEALLNEGLDPNHRMPALVVPEEQVDELTPLACAVMNGHSSTAAVLLSGGADPNTCVGKTALSPLHLAARSGDEALARLLLASGADPEKRDLAFHATPADFALHFHHDRLAGVIRGEIN